MKMRKLVSLFLAVFMVTALLPVQALAAEIGSTVITLSLPQPGSALPDTVTAADGVTVSTVQWKTGDVTLENGTLAKYSTAYTVELTLSPGTDNTFADSFTATMEGFTNIQTQKVENGVTVTAEYTTPKADAPIITAGNITVPNAGASSTYTFTASGLLAAADYPNSGISYKVSETEDPANILTLPTASGTLAASNTISYTVAANAVGEAAKTAKFQITFSAGENHDYQSLPASVDVTVNLQAGASDPTITINSVTPTENPIEKPAGYEAFALTVNASAADSAALSYAWSVDNVSQSVNANTFTVPAGLAAGDHSVTCYVTSPTNPTGASHTFQIRVAAPNAIPVPTVKNPVYNGTAQTPDVAVSDHYTVTVTPQTDVKTNGSYEITFSLKDKTANAWLLASGATTTEDQVVLWNIEPKLVKIYGVTATDKIYDASATVRITGGELKTSDNGSEAYAVLTGDAVVLRGTFRSARAADANAGINKTVVVSGFTLDGADAANYLLIQPDDVRVTIHPATPTITLYNYTAAYTGLPISISRAVVSGVPGGTTPSGYIYYTYYTDSACSKLTTAANGAAYAGGAPSAPGTYYVSAHISASGNYTSAYAYAAVLKIVTDFNVNFDITATSNRGGSISPSGTVKVASGGDKTFTFKPKDGYELVDVLVDGESIGVVTSYTFRNVKADHTIKAIFTSEEEEVPPAWENPFYDVSRSDWFYDAVEYAVTNRLMEGVSGSTFAPAVVTTRAEMVTILWRLSGRPDANTVAGFRDLTQNWYVEAVNWAAENNIVEGVGDATFAPDEAVTREQIATMLYRYAQYQGYDTSAYSSFNKFVDGADVSGFAEDAMHWAVSENIILGKGNSRLAPQGAASRAEVAEMVWRFAGTVKE